MSDEQDSPPVERMYTYAEVAELLRVKPRTIMRRQWVEQNARYRGRHGRTRYIPESVVKRWLAERWLKVRPPGSRQESQTA